MRRTVIGIVAMTTALVGLSAPSAGAAPRPPLHFSTTDVFLGTPGTDCGSFSIADTGFSRSRFEMITWFDKAGQPDRVFEHYSFDGELTNLSTGKSVKDHFEEIDTFSIVNGDDPSFTTRGVIYHYTLPHEGLVLAVSGTITVNAYTGDILFQAGPHDDVSTEAICALLA